MNSDDYLVGHYDALDAGRGDFRNSNLFSLIASLVKGRTVVDIGCGIGSFASILQKQGKTVIGIEPSAGMRELAAVHYPGVDIRTGGAEEVDSLVREKVDSVTMLDVLEHIERDAEQVRKVHTILDEKGEFVIVVPCHQFLFGERDRQAGHFRRYTKKSLRKVLEQNGFTVTFMRHWNVLGVMPYFISECVLRRPLQTSLREGQGGGVVKKTVRRALYLWFKHIENNINFGFGLSLICVAKKR